MTFDKHLFAEKLVRCSEHVGLDAASVAKTTGISTDRMVALRRGLAEPTGDEILIFADLFKIDFKFFVSGDAKAPFDQMEILYRKFGDQIGPPDRQAVAEMLYLCDTEEILQAELGRSVQRAFAFSKAGTHFKTHGEDAARELRKHLGLSDTAMAGDVFAVARGLGIHVFRRRLHHAGISGLTIRHPNAGPCVLVNFDEDPYRQRFTLAHEMGHVFLDAEDDVVVSFTKWTPGDLREIRANTFAASFLVPRSALQTWRGRLPDEADFIALAHRLEVNAETLGRSMLDAGAIGQDDLTRLRRIRLPRFEKHDTELTAGLTARQRDRKKAMLERGLSQSYVELCLDAYAAERISRGRLAEALLVDHESIVEIALLYGRRLAHACWPVHVGAAIALIRRAIPANSAANSAAASGGASRIRPPSSVRREVIRPNN
ncbi:MAG: ImmA/IrrE family metallo-endopeptidase [Bacteroidota bacterium]